MSEKGANIDLLFRNGLKDYEVLPPPGVWDGIHSAVKITSRPVIFLRVAAAAAVLVTASFLTYRWSSDITSTPSGSVMAFNIPSISPEILSPVSTLQNSELNNSDRIINNTIASFEMSNSVSIIEEIQSPVITPEHIIYSQAMKNISLISDKSIIRPFQTSDQAVVLNPVIVNYTDLQYFPETAPVKPVNRWSIAAMASPTYYSSFSSGSNGLSQQLMASEEPLFSYSGGVAFSYKISKRFSIQSGLYYASLGQKVDGISSFSGFQPFDNTKGDHNFEVLTTLGTVYTNNPDIFLSSDASGRINTPFTVDVIDPKKASLQPVNTSLNQNFSYLELPVILRYKIVDKTIGINLIGGLSYNMLVHNSVYTTLDGNKFPVGDTKGLNPLSLSSSFGMGMEYNISGKLSLNLEPTFRYYLNPFNITSGSYIHPYSFGIFSGVSYKF
jgi:hypothetical protein